MNLKLQGYFDSISDKRVAVIGAGISNIPLINMLLDSKIRTEVHDKVSRTQLGETAAEFESKGAVLKLGGDYLKSLTADIIFRTPGLMPSDEALQKAVAQGAQLTSEMELFFDICPCKIIAVTGSDGKTTTTSLIAQMLEAQGYTVHLGGNIGTPLLSKTGAMSPGDFAVVELSSFQLITMTKSPQIAVVTNVTPNHLDKHTDMAEYVEAKRNIFINQQNTGMLVLNLDNDITRGFAGDSKCGCLFFSRRETVTNGFYLKNGIIYQSVQGHSEAVMNAGDVLLPGEHNLENIMAACAAVNGLVTPSVMADTARSFKGVAHRQEFIRELRGVRFYNDSMASGPTRTIAGLRSFDRKVILIAGGKDKGVSFDELGTEIVERVKTLVLTGDTASAILNSVLTAPGYKGYPTVIMSPDLNEAVNAAFASASEGDIVLMSPAGTSFDRYKNFEERGNLFRELVKGLK